MKRPGSAGTWPGRLFVTTLCLTVSISVIGCAEGGKSDGDSVDPQKADAERLGAEAAMRNGYTPKNLRPEKPKAKGKGKNSPSTPTEAPASSPSKAG